MTSPLASPAAYDRFTLDGVISPGLSKITSGGIRAFEIQNQMMPGYAGQFTVMRYELVGWVEYSIELWEEHHFKEFDVWADMLNKGADQRWPGGDATGYVQTLRPKTYSYVDLRVKHSRYNVVALWTLGPQVPIAPTKFSHAVKFSVWKRPKPIGGPMLPAKNSVEQRIEKELARGTELDAQLESLKAAAAAKRAGG